MERPQLYLLVRDPDDRWDRDNITALTRQRVLERFPGTDERHLMERNLLVVHPLLHPSCARKLLPAEKLYTALRVQSEEELFGALVKLGATEVELEQVDEGSESSTKSGGVGGGGGVTVDTRVSQTKKSKERTVRKIRLRADPVEVESGSLDPYKFFEELVFHRDNKTLRVLFDLINSGRACNDYLVEYKHTVERSYAFEASITAAYLKIFQVQLDFKHEHEENQMERAVLIAKFK